MPAGEAGRLRRVGRGRRIDRLFQGRFLAKDKSDVYGETGKALDEFYFSGDQLIFVLRTESRNTKPLSGVVKSKTEERFYFAEGKLIQWLGSDKKPMALGPEAEERGREELAQARKFSAMVSR